MAPQNQSPPTQKGPPETNISKLSELTLRQKPAHLSDSRCPGSGRLPVVEITESTHPEILNLSFEGGSASPCTSFKRQWPVAQDGISRPKSCPRHLAENTAAILKAQSDTRSAPRSQRACPKESTKHQSCKTIGRNTGSSRTRCSRALL